MTTLREAAQQALDALLTYEQYIQPLTNVFGGPRVPEEGSASAKVDAAITALRAALVEDALQKFTDVSQEIEAALAEPVQEPVASVTECEACFTPDVCQLRGTCDHYAAERLRVAAPPQREPLTEEEIRDLWSWAMTAEAERTATTQQHAFARAIERAHGIGEQK